MCVTMDETLLIVTFFVSLFASHSQSQLNLN